MESDEKPAVRTALQNALGDSRTKSLELSIVVPTLNEKLNVEPLLERLDQALPSVAWEVIFVDDDSKDGTAELIRSIAARDPRVRILQRIGRRGLCSACMEGMMASAASYVAVMDADLQHEESVLPSMLELLREQELDLVVGSRNVSGGSMGSFAARRQALSHWGRHLSRMISRCELQDPMSGFFIADRRFIDSAIRRMSGVSFKVLLDLVSSSPRPVRFREYPYTFRKRESGDSKLDSTNLVEYLLLIVDKLIRGWLPVRFVLFGIVGCLGIVLHFTVLISLYEGWKFDFVRAQIAGTVAAMTLNFLLNNVVTYRDKRLRGLAMVKGLFSFYLVCSVGALVNVQLADFFFSHGVAWYLAGASGILVGAVWNYAVSSLFTWRGLRRN